MSRDLRSAQAYAVIESLSRTEGHMTTRDSGVHNPWGEIVFALDSASRRHLLVPVSPDAAVVEDRKSAGVHLFDIGVLEAAGPRYADVTCIRPHLATIFEVLVDELLDVLDGSKEPVHIVQAVLNRWRELFERSQSSLLGTEQLAGLVGELIVLRSLASQGPAPTADWWTGPVGHVHDIVGPGHSLEVKTTLRRDDSIVVVNGLGQFADLAGRTLHVVLVRLLHDPAGSLSLPALIDDLAENGMDRAKLISLALSVGADPRDYPAYGEILFEPIEMKAYSPSQPRFPKLTGESLNGPVPNGVTRVQYLSDLNVAEAGALKGGDLDLLFQEISKDRSENDVTHTF